jgi:septal ring factor EnvC (AmiA/AmiB activator)
MRALRERPRLAAAKLTGALAALIAAALVAVAIAVGDHEAPPDLRPQLERSEQLRDEQTSELRHLDAEVARLRADLRAATRRAREGARASERLRRRLLTVRRGLARERQR